MAAAEPVVPSEDPTSYCRLCFLKAVHRVVTCGPLSEKWLNRINSCIVGLQLNIAVDSPFGICYGCCCSLETIEKFRTTSLQCDQSLRKYKQQFLQPFQSAPVIPQQSTQQPAPSPVILPERIPMHFTTSDGRPISISVLPTTSRTDSEKNSVPPLVMLDRTPGLVITQVNSLAPSAEVNSGKNASTAVTPQSMGESSVLVKQGQESVEIIDLDDDSSSSMQTPTVSSSGATTTTSKSHPVDNEPTKCYACLLQFDSMRQFRSHKLANHPKVGGRYRCSRCMVAILRYPTFQRHCLQHLKPNWKRNVCDICGEHFSNAADFGSHQMEVHNLRYGCQKCNKHYNSQTFLNEHMKYHAKRMVRRSFLYKCIHCNKGFNDNAQAQAHVSEHNVRFICNLCNDVSYKVNQYVDHQMAVHGVSNNRCLACSMQFSQRNAYTQHINKTHRLVDKLTEALENQDNDVYNCRFCSETCTGRGAWIAHEFLHNVSYVCGFCEKHLKSPKSYIDHQTTEHGGASSRCVKCGIHFFSRNDYLSHIDDHHRIMDPIASEEPPVVPLEIEDSDEEFAAEQESYEIGEEIYPDDSEDNSVDNGDATVQPAEEDTPIFSEQRNDEGTTSDSSQTATNNEDEYAEIAKQEQSNVFDEICSSKTDKCYACVEDFADEQQYKEHLLQKHPKVDGSLECPRCLVKIRLYSNLQRHFLLHLKPTKIHTCDICCISFNIGAQLGQHQADVHQQTLECTKCFRRYDDIKHLTEHMMFHLKPDGVQGYNCKLCEQNFPDITSLKLHFQGHEQRYFCDLCDHKFISLRAYIEHQKTEHNAPEEPQKPKCMSCNLEFPLRKTYMRHITREHLHYNRNTEHTVTYGEKTPASNDPLENPDSQSTNAEQVEEENEEASTTADDHQPSTVEEVIEGSNQGFLAEEGTHAASSSPKPDKPVTCFACVIVCASRKEYHQHLKTAHKKVNGMFSCPRCKDKMSRYNTFQPHFITHLKPATNYYCDVCDAGFADGPELSAHQLGVHQLHHECSLCYRRYETKKILLQHQRFHKYQDGGRTFNCRLCDATLPSKAAHSLHFKEHNLRFNCELCGNFFFTVQSLLEHQEQKHDGNSNYCASCKHHFNLRKSLIAHINLKHIVFEATVGDIYDDSLNPVEDINGENPSKHDSEDSSSDFIGFDEGTEDIVPRREFLIKQEIPATLEDPEQVEEPSSRADGPPEPKRTKVEFSDEERAVEELYGAIEEDAEDGGEQNDGENFTMFDIYGSAFQAAGSLKIYSDESDGS